jgi:adenine-specific DNA-methyltransferase
MEKLKMQSPDLGQQKLLKIREIFPNCVTEFKDPHTQAVSLGVDFEKLKEEVSACLIEDGEERYQFTWPDKRAAMHEANVSISKTLRPCKEESVNFDTTQNLYIEGDNLEALKLLRESYLGKVKMIYIDPPYNTGHDFVYNDKFSASYEDFANGCKITDEDGNILFTPKENSQSNGRFHTDWLNMMYPRLKVAKDLLSEDGLIFISIDDNEVANLRKLCDEIFGENSFISQIAWRRSDNQPNVGVFARVKEYILLYAKNRSQCSIGRLPLTAKAQAEYRYQDAKGKFRRDILLHKTRGRHFYKKLTKLGTVLEGPWMVPESVFDEMDAKGEIYWTESGDGQPYGKIYLNNSKGQIPNDFWGIEFGTNQRGSIEVEQLLGKRCFDFPKPVSLMENLLQIGAKKDSIVLDFFSGSATTAHAVLNLNAKDQGKRKFILVQMPEKTPVGSIAEQNGFSTICDIGKKRIKEAALSIAREQGVLQKSSDLGFRVLKVSESNMEDIFYTPSSLKQEDLFLSTENVKPDRTSEDLLFQIMPECGCLFSDLIEEVSVSGKKIFKVNNGLLIACFDTGLDEEAITEIAKMQPVYFVMRDSAFAKDNVIDNFDQIFQSYSPSTKLRIL